METYVILRRSGWRVGRRICGRGRRAVDARTATADAGRRALDPQLRARRGRAARSAPCASTRRRARRRSARHASRADLPVDEIIAVADTVDRPARPRRRSRPDEEERRSTMRRQKLSSLALAALTLPRRRRARVRRRSNSHSEPRRHGRPPTAVPRRLARRSRPATASSATPQGIACIELSPASARWASTTSTCALVGDAVLDATQPRGARVRAAAATAATSSSRSSTSSSRTRGRRRGTRRRRPLR